MKLALLATDLLLLSLLLVVAIYVLYVRGRAHLLAPWRQVAQRPLGMAAALVLSLFVIVAVLDSVRFQAHDSIENTSVLDARAFTLLDALLHPLPQQVETTYSAPFATHGYSKTLIEKPTGELHWDYPSLRYGGSHLAPSERTREEDIVIRCVRGFAFGLCCWFAVALAVLFAIARRIDKNLGHTLALLARGQLIVPLRTLLGVVAVLAIAVAILLQLLPYYHVLGTDKVGMDVFYQSLKSVRTGLVIGTVTTLVMFPFALALGVVAGYFGGWIDDIVQYLYTTLSSIPGVLLIAAAALTLDVYMNRHATAFDSVAARADARLLALCLILGVTNWTTLCRLLRGETLKLREANFVVAARALGSSQLKVVAKHLVPNVMHIVMISLVLDFSALVLAEAVLSYINIGVDPAMESWGNMINSARLELAREPTVWWSLLAAFCFMFILVLAANIFADAVRDAFDPRWRKAQAS